MAGVKPTAPVSRRRFIQCATAALAAVWLSIIAGSGANIGRRGGHLFSHGMKTVDRPVTAP
jgi:hypothetical protein